MASHLKLLTALRHRARAHALSFGMSRYSRCLTVPSPVRLQIEPVQYIYLCFLLNRKTSWLRHIDLKMFSRFVFDP